MAPNRPNAKKAKLATKVAVAYIHPPNYVAPEFMRCLLNLFVRDAYVYPGRIVRPIEYVSSANVSLARNKCVQAFLDHPEKPQWLLFIDADMTFADDILDTLLDAAAGVKKAGVEQPAIIGGLCFGVATVKRDGVEQLNGVQAAAYELFPTIFTQDVDAETTIRWAEYPKTRCSACIPLGLRVC